MYTIVFLMYLGNTVNVLNGFLFVFLIILGAMLLINYFVYINTLSDIDVYKSSQYAKEYKEEIKNRFEPILKKWFKIFLVILFFEIFLPSKNVIYTYAAVESANTIYHSNKNIPKIVNTAIEYIQIKLQNDLNDEKKEIKNIKGK